jgi:putative hemolysin
MLQKVLSKLFALDRLDRLYEQVVSAHDSDSIFKAVCDALDIGIVVAAAEWQKIPRSGPVIFLVNHPTGVMEGLTMTALLEQVRPGVRTLSHSWFSRYPKIARRMFLVDPQAGRACGRENIKTVGKAAKWVAGNGALITYPAGEVARFNWGRMRVTDSHWKTGAVRILRKTGATAVPVFLDGRNSLIYHVLSAIHPRLGALVLIIELFRKQGRRITARIGEPITVDQLPWTEGTEAVVDHLREAVENLGPAGSPNTHTDSDDARRCGSELVRTPAVSR